MSEHGDLSPSINSRVSTDTSFFYHDIEKASFLPKSSFSSEDDLQTPTTIEETNMSASSPSSMNASSPCLSLKRISIGGFVEKHPKFNTLVPLSIWLVNPFIWWKMGWDKNGTLIMGTVQSMVTIGITTLIWYLFAPADQFKPTKSSTESVTEAAEQLANEPTAEHDTDDVLSSGSKPLDTSGHIIPTSGLVGAERGATGTTRKARLWEKNDTKGSVAFFWMMALVAVTNGLVGIPWTHVKSHSPQGQRMNYRPSRSGNCGLKLTPPVECQINVTTSANSVDSTFVINGITHKLAGCLKRTPNHQNPTIPNVKACLEQLDIPNDWQEAGWTTVTTEAGPGAP